MFAEHQHIIQGYAEMSPMATFRVLEFVQATISQRFYHVPRILRDLDAKKSSTFLTKRQHACLLTYAEEQDAIYKAIYSLSTKNAMAFLVNLPGLGIVKAGFVLQLCQSKVGCLDTHNLRKFGMNANAFRVDCTEVRLQERIQAYIAICESYGIGRLWDEWCTLIAYKYPKRFTDAESVSRLHVECILR